MTSQRVLLPENVSAFHHNLFVEDQLADFAGICLPLVGHARPIVVDIGGGCGFFAAELEGRFGVKARVIDLDQDSVALAAANGIEALCGDALAFSPRGDEGVVCFNLVLHHAVGESELVTRELQRRMIANWRESGALLFAHELIYESWFPGLSSRLIFQVTSSRILSFIGRAFSRAMPSLAANTFGVGVRFRESDDWVRLFGEAGFELVDVRRGRSEKVPFARRLLMIKSCFRQSYVFRANRSELGTA